MVEEWRKKWRKNGRWMEDGWMEGGKKGLARENHDIMPMNIRLQSLLQHKGEGIRHGNIDHRGHQQRRDATSQDPPVLFGKSKDLPNHPEGGPW